MKAIIIDDERLARKELTSLLENHPEIEIIDEAANADEAVEKIEKQNPDVIFLDIQMPGMDGLEAIEQIRRNLNLVDVPIIALTALAMKGDRDRCLQAGANDYLSKPFKLKELVNSIEKLLTKG